LHAPSFRLPFLQTTCRQPQVWPDSCDRGRYRYSASCDRDTSPTPPAALPAGTYYRTPALLTVLPTLPPTLPFTWLPVRPAGHTHTPRMQHPAAPPLPGSWRHVTHVFSMRVLRRAPHLLFYPYGSRYDLLLQALVLSGVDTTHHFCWDCCASSAFLLPLFYCQ